MPKIWDLSAEEAENVLRESGLEYNVHNAQTTVVPKGELITVSPRPGAPLEDGVWIILTVSSGPPKLPQPAWDNSESNESTDCSTASYNAGAGLEAGPVASNCKPVKDLGQ